MKSRLSSCLRVAFALLIAVSAPAVLAQSDARLREQAKTAAHASAELPDALAQGMSIARLGRIAPVMRDQVRDNVVPGAVTLVARYGEIVHFEATGYQDAKKSIPLRTDAIFRLASMTKPIVTVAAMMLVEQGRLQLGDPIVKWLPELKDLKVETPAGDVPLARPIWVQDLMRHTSGFVYQGGTKSARIRDAYAAGNIESREKDITSEEMLRNLGKIPLANQPGTVWEYSISVDVLGLLLERVTGKTLDVVLRELLLDPLGMNDTAFWVPPEKASRLAEALDSDKLKAEMSPGYRIFSNPVGKSYLKGGAGLVGTATDYLRFAQMIANEGEYNGKRYLSRKSVQFMLSDHTVGMGGTTFASTGPGYAFGLGFAVRSGSGLSWTAGSPGDAMWAGAWGTSFWVDPAEGLVGIFMSQAPSTRVQTRMLYKNLVYGAMMR